MSFQIKFTLIALATTLFACIPANVNSPSGGFGTSSIFPSLGTLDGAQGQCLSYSLNTPQRQFCVDCYNSILATHCPGQTDPSTCQDPTVVNTFTNLVNQCISQSVVAGFTCSLTCGASTQLQANTCTCVSTNTTVPAGGTGSGLIDSGQVNAGPPVVSAYWPSGNGVGAPGTTSCQATITPIYMLIQNRGGTVPQLNQYSVGQSTATTPYCVAETTDANGNLKYVASENNFAGQQYVNQTSSPPSIPTSTGTGTASVQFSVKTTGSNEFVQAGFGETIISEAFEGALPKPAAPAVPRWSANASTAAIGGSRALGPFGNNAQVTLSLNTKPGFYYLRFDLMTLDTWAGDSLGTRFGLNINNTAVFLQSFTNNTPGGTQTYYNVASAGNLNGNGIADKRYHIELTYYHAGGPMALTFFDQNLDATLGSWAIDNLQVNRSIQRKCAIRYNFTDSNSLTSSYCLRFRIRTDCHSTGPSAGNSTCSCYAEPDSADFGSYFTGENPNTQGCLSTLIGI